MSIRRGCGYRRPGIYLSVGMSPFGMPLEHFLLCPALRMPEGDICAQGQTVVDLKVPGRSPATGLIDIIGAGSYPNVVDFIEEGRRFGFSLRANPKIVPQIKSPVYILPAHERAIIENWLQYPGRTLDTCPHGYHPVDDCDDRNMSWFGSSWYAECFNGNTYPFHGCLGYLWEDIEGGEPAAAGGRFVVRTMPSFEYRGLAHPDGVEAVYQMGIFARLPVARLEVVASQEEDETEYYREIAERSDLPVVVVGE